MELGDKLEDEAMEIEEEIIMEEEEGKIMIAIVQYALQLIGLFILRFGPVRCRTCCIMPQYTMLLLSFRT